VNKSIEIEEILHKCIPDYDTSKTKIFHYKFMMTDIKTYKTLLDNQLDQKRRHM